MSVVHLARTRVYQTVLGINPESPVLVTAAILISVLLAAAISVRPISPVPAIAGAFGLIFAFVDILEIFHQVQEGRPSLVAVAALATLLHLTVAALAAAVMRRTRSDILKQGAKGGDGDR